MKKLDVKSLLIGVLISAVAALCMAAASGPETGRYSVTISATSNPNVVYTCVADTSTGEYAVGQCVQVIPVTHSRVMPMGKYPNLLMDKDLNR